MFKAIPAEKYYDERELWLPAYEKALKTNEKWMDLENCKQWRLPVSFASCSDNSGKDGGIRGI